MSVVRSASIVALYHSLRALGGASQTRCSCPYGTLQIWGAIRKLGIMQARPRVESAEL